MSLYRVFTEVEARRGPDTTVTRPGILLGSLTSPPGEKKEVEETEEEEDEKTECSQDFINSLEIKDCNEKDGL